MCVFVNLGLKDGSEWLSLIKNASYACRGFRMGHHKKMLFFLHPYIFMVPHLILVFKKCNKMH